MVNYTFIDDHRMDELKNKIIKKKEKMQILRGERLDLGSNGHSQFLYEVIWHLNYNM